MTTVSSKNKIRRELHISDLQMFRQCRLKWRLGSPRQMNLESKAPQSALWLGTGVHLGLEAYYKGKFEGYIVDPAEVFEDWANQHINIARNGKFLSEEEDQKMRDDKELGIGMLRHYTVWAPTVDNFDIILVEEEFELTVHETDTHEYVVKGRIDGAIQDREGIWIFEHKTTAHSNQNVQRLFLDEQAGEYIWAGSEILGKPVQGSLYNFLRKKLPTYPRVLQAGGLSVAANIDTTYEVYMQAIKDNNLREEDYFDYLEHLKEKGNTFFQREYTQRNPNEIRHLMHRLVEIDRDMERAEQEKAFYPSPSPTMCPMCTFFKVCLVRAEDGDVGFMLRNSYQQRPKKEELEWLPVLEE